MPVVSSPYYKTRVIVIATTILLLFSSVSLSQFNGIKPNLGTQLDFSNPLAKGLVGCWLLRNKEPELLSGKMSTLDNTATIITPYGSGIKCVTGQVNLEWNSEFILTSDGLGTGDFTMAVLANPATGSNVEHIFVQKNDAGGSPYSQACLLANSDDAASGLSGSFCFFTYSAASTTITKADVVDNKWHLYVGTRQGTVLSLSVDGVEVATKSGTIRDISMLPSSRYTALGSRGNGTNEGYTQSIAAAWAWNRALSANEVAQLYYESFGMFQQEQPWMWVSAEAPPEDESQVILISSIARYGPLVVLVALAYWICKQKRIGRKRQYGKK